MLLSGPPGGTLLLLTRHYETTAHDEATLDRLVRIHFHRPGYGSLVVGKPSHVMAAGEQRLALGVVAGEGQALIPVNGSRTTGVFAIAGVTASSGAQPDCDAVVSNRQVAPVWKTLKVSDPTPKD